MTALFILMMIAGCTPCKGDDNLVVTYLVPIVGLAMMAVIIWGSVVVFGKLNEYRISANSFHGNYLFFFELLKLCNEDLNSFLTRVRKLFKGGNYSREETIRIF